MKKRNHFFLIPFLLSLALLNNYQPAEAQTPVRLGLHYTDLELTAWKARTPLYAGTDKYATTGDVSTYSPGDWNRIVTNKNTFNANPAADRYTNFYTGTGAVPQDQGGLYDPEGKAIKLRDAAFYYLISSDATTLAKVRTELLWHAQNPGLDFTNTTRWPAGRLVDVNPGFVIAEWLTRMLYGYDYVKAGLSGGDKATLNAWFLGAARYMKTNYDPGLDGLFVSRATGNYTLTQSTLNKQFGLNGAEASTPKLLYYGGPSAYYVSKIYSNRRVTMASFVGLAGIFLNDAALRFSAKRFVQEYFMFAVYPDGTAADFFRSLSDSRPDKGLGYSTGSQMIAFIDALARAGDASLYTFTTTQGDVTPPASSRTTNGSTQKGLRMHIQKMLDMGNNVGTPLYSSTSSTSNVNKRMDWDDAVYNTHYPNFLAYAPAAVFYGDSYFAQSVNRTYGSQGGVYRSSYTAIGSSPAYSVIGQFPAPSLMFVDVGINPYGATAGKQNQTITFNALPGKTFGDPSFALTATAGSGLAVTYTSSNTDVATISGSTLTVVGAGSAVITASQAGNGSYNAAPDKTQTLLVAKASQTITFPIIADRIITGGKFRLPTSTSTSGGGVTFSVTSGPAYISNSDTLNPTGVGSVTVTASQAGSTNYLPAQPVTRTFAFTPATPTAVTDVVSGVTAVDSNQVVYDAAGQQRLKSSRHFVLASTHTGYNIQKVTIPSGFRQPLNTLGKIELWVRDGSGVSTFVQTLDATAQPIFETPVAYTGNVKEIYFVAYGASIPSRVPAGSTGIKVEGF